MQNRTFRAKPHNLCMSDATPFGQAYTYHDGFSVDYMLNEEFFLSCRSNLKAGDTIRVAWMDNGRVEEIAEILIVEVRPDAIEFYMLREPVSLAVEEEEEAAPKETPEIYVDGDGYTTKHKGRGQWAVLDPDGMEVAAGLDKETASAVRAGALPIPQAA